MDEREFLELLIECINEGGDAAVEALVGEDDAGAPEVLGTFRDCGIMTNNRGLVVRVGDAEFQLTVVRSK